MVIFADDERIAVFDKGVRNPSFPVVLRVLLLAIEPYVSKHS